MDTRLIRRPSLRDEILNIKGCVRLYLQDELTGTLARDQTNAANGTYTSTPAIGRAPLTPAEVASVKFGSGSYTLLQTGYILAAGATASVIVSMKTTRTDDRCLYSERAASGNDIWNFRVLATGKTTFRRRNTAGTLSNVDGLTNVNDGKPHVIGFTKATNAIVQYRDGAADGTGTLGGNDTLTNASPSCRVGLDVQDGSGFSWQDTIGFVALFNRALTAGEMRAIALAALA